MRKKVVITGADMITPAGADLSSTWNALVNGKSCIGALTRFDASDLDTRIAGQIPDSFNETVSQFCRKRIAKQMTFVSRMAFVAASRAITSSEIDFDKCDRGRVATVLGIVNTGYNSLEAVYENDRIVKAMNNAPSAWISLEYGLEGPNFPIATACASSAYAMSLAYEMIVNGQADVVITGGADSTLCPEEIRGFNQILALSTRNDDPAKASRPFTKSRDGFVMGEGAAILVLESEEHAIRRNAPVIAELAGYALTSEAHNIVSPKPEGEGMALTMEKAVVHAGVDKNEVSYINAHGTSTLLNDRYETQAIRKVFGERAIKIPVSSTKSMIGHTIGAAGAIEGLVTALSIKNDILTPTINYDDPDPELDLDYVPNVARQQKTTVALSNSFGFGGHNATLVFRKYY